MKTLKFVFGFIFLAIAIISCSKDESTSKNSGVVALNAKATYNAAARLNARANSIAISSFIVNLKEIEFEFNDDNENNDDDLTSDFGFDDDLKLNGPFQLNLLNAPATLTIAELPNGVYEEIEFKLDKNDIASNLMFNKSIEIKGTINGTPFVYWDDEDESFEVDFDDSNNNITVANNTLNLSLEFNLNEVVSAVNLASATDGNGNGIIEIGPNNIDGNGSLADQIDDKLEEFADLND